MTVGPGLIDATRAALAARPLGVVAVAVAALIAALGLSLVVASGAEAGKLGNAKKAIKKEIRSQGAQPIKVSCRMKGKPHKPPGRYAKCKWASAQLDSAGTTRTCRGEGELIGKRKRQRLKFRQTSCKVDKGATKNNEFMPAQLAKKGYESTYVFCYTNLVNGFKCKWEALNFRLNVIEDCVGRAANIKKKVTIRTKKCGVNQAATQAQSSVKKKLTSRGLNPGQINCRPGGIITCDYRATISSAGWTYSCEGGADLQNPSAPPKVDPCDLHAPDLAPVKSPGPRPYFGVNEAWQSMLGQIDELAGIGATTARMSIPWNNVEENKNSYNWAVSDAAYNRLLNHGVKPVLIITGAPCWARPGDCGFTFPPSSAHLGDWGDFAAAVANRYPNALAIEVWNEANTSKFFQGGPDPALYSKLLEHAYDSIKAVRPQMAVLTTGLAAHANNEPGQQRYDDFLREIYKRGAKNHSDAIGHHAYPGGGPEGNHREAIRTQLADLKDVMLDFGDQNKDIWITESGVSTTASGGKAYSAAQQAKVYAGLYKLYRQVPGIPTAIFHRWRDAGPGNGPESGFGLQASNGSNKPVLCSLASAAGSPC